MFPAPADPDFVQRTRASFARQGAMAHLGAVIGRVEAGRVEISMPFRPELSQQHGFFHAGMIATIADSAGGYAAFTLMPADASVLTVEYKVNMLSPAEGELLIARGEVLKPGRTLSVVRADVWARRGDRETRVAAMQQTLMVMHGTPDERI